MKFWDLLYQRYSNPLELLQQMFETGQLYDFIEELVQIRNEEMQEKSAWEFYLHKIHDMTFEEFMKKAAQPAEPETISKDRMTEIVKRSLEILGKK
jgi:ribosome maturation protein Sdo1